MMEPVAWASPNGRLNNIVSHKRNGTFTEPLVRLSDAEARIKELEQAVAYESGDPLALSAHQKLFERLHAAEARIKELEAKIELLELEAEGHDNGKRDLAEALNCADEPRWKWMRLEAVKLKARAEAAEADKTALLQAIKHHSGSDHGLLGIRLLVERAEAAEDRLKEAGMLAKIAIGAEKMMNGAAIYFAADGERDDAKKLTKVATIMGEHARALKSKIGVKDE